MGRFLTITYQWARRCVIAVIGTTVILIGIAMLVLPGPAFIVIPAGLAILGLEFAFARRWLRRLKATGSQVVEYTFARFRGSKSNSRPKPDQRVATTARHTSTPAFEYRQLARERSREIGAARHTGKDH